MITHSKWKRRKKISHYLECLTPNNSIWAETKCMNNIKINSHFKYLARYLWNWEKGISWGLKRERSNCRWPAHRTEQLSLAHILCSSHCSLSKLQTLSNGMQQANLNKYMAPFPEATYWQRSMSVYYSLGEQSEKAMATHSSTLAWKIPWTEEPSRLQSMGSRNVRHNWATFF